MAAYTALFDACVLYPQTLRDVLLSLARTELFRARWSATINAEWTAKRLDKRPDLATQIARTLEAVNASVPDCLVTGYESLIPSLTLPDPDDRHVLAAAIVGRADVIVTANLKDFPRDAVSLYHIDVQAPDVFITHQLSLDKDRAVSAFKAMRGRLKKPVMTPSEFIEHLKTKHLVNTTDMLREFADDI